MSPKSKGHRVQIIITIPCCQSLPSLQHSQNNVNNDLTDSSSKESSSATLNNKSSIHQFQAQHRSAFSRWQQQQQQEHPSIYTTSKGLRMHEMPNENQLK